MLVMDVQNDFFDPKGVLFNSRFPGRLPAILQTVEACKKENLFIITTQDWHKPKDPEFRLFPAHCMQNTWGAELTEEMKRALYGYPRHIRIFKNHFSAFRNTTLEEILRNNRVQECVLCGVMLNICILFTCEDLFYAEIPTAVLTNASEGPSEEVSRWSLEQLKNVFGVTLIDAYR
jgi:nicotinamidase/pyrazinamidase